MQYVIAFLEGVITFISPCLLPMLPIYISYFAGGGERSTGKTLKGALGFVTGFTVVLGCVMEKRSSPLGTFTISSCAQAQKQSKIPSSIDVAVICFLKNVIYS